MTEWRVIEGYGYRYEVSTEGRVRVKASKRVLMPHLKDGYLAVKLSVNGKRKRVRLHRLVAEAFLPPHPTKLQVNHKDGNKANPRLDNLEWCSAAENMQHAWDTGLCQPRGMAGSKNPNVALSEGDVVAIKRLLAEGRGARELGRQFGVHHATISKIKLGQRWAEIKI